jgi:hypothetical protein
MEDSPAHLNIKIPGTGNHDEPREEDNTRDDDDDGFDLVPEFDTVLEAISKCTV